MTQPSEWEKKKEELVERLYESSKYAYEPDDSDSFILKDIAGQAIDWARAETMKEMAEQLEQANNLIRKFDPDDCFVFEDGSEDLQQEVTEYLEELAKLKEKV